MRERRAGLGVGPLSHTHLSLAGLLLLLGLVGVQAFFGTRPNIYHHKGHIGASDGLIDEKVR